MSSELTLLPSVRREIVTVLARIIKIESRITLQKASIDGGGDMEGENGKGVIEMSYSSTARGAAVLDDEGDLERAVEKLGEGGEGLDLEDVRRKGLSGGRGKQKGKGGEGGRRMKAPSVLGYSA